MTKYFVLALCACILTLASQGVASKLGYESYKETLGALLNISSIIFAIIGAWIAVIYPRAIGRIFKGNSVSDLSIREADSDAKYLSELVEIVLVSATVLMIVLVIQFCAPILRELIHGDALILAKRLAFGVISFLTISQLYAISQVVLANYFFLNELREKNANAKIDSLHRR